MREFNQLQDGDFTPDEDPSGLAELDFEWITDGLKRHRDLR